MSASKKYKLQVPMNIDLKKKAEQNAKKLGLSSVQEYIRFLIHNNNENIILPLKEVIKENDKNKKIKSNAKKFLNSLKEAQKVKNVWIDESGLKYRKKVGEEWNQRLKNLDW